MHGKLTALYRPDRVIELIVASIVDLRRTIQFTSGRKLVGARWKASERPFQRSRER